ncbi:MAG: ZIP family metal transporter [Solirubrobacteraceae bacterium]
MSFAETGLLGAIAGFTIFLGLPVGRLSRVDDRARVALAMFSVGILAFIFVDVTGHGQEIVDNALTSYKQHDTSLAHVVGLFALLAVGFTAGTAGISAIERYLRRRAVPPPIAGGEAAATLTADELTKYEFDARRVALRSGMTIAFAIGLHNFAEGLAIGVSAKSGAIGLATVLIIGFGLHNATEGFGIVGPLGGVRPSWRWLLLAGLVGGGPTFVGTIVGYQVHSDPLELCFYALAGGAILYVVGEIWTAVRRYGYRTLGLYFLAAGFLIGVATDLIVTYGGA